MDSHGLEQIRLDIVDDLSSLLRAAYQGTAAGFATFGTTDRNEIRVRLAGALLVLERLHQVDDLGRCRLCRPGRSKRRRWRWPARKSPCRVLKTVTFFATASEEDIWLRLVGHLGIRVGLNQLRAHLADRAAGRHLAGTVPIPAQTAGSGRHFLVP
jgi:hypothetical protein